MIWVRWAWERHRFQEVSHRPVHSEEAKERGKGLGAPCSSSVLV